MAPTPLQRCIKFLVDLLAVTRSITAGWRGTSRHVLNLFVRLVRNGRRAGSRRVHSTVVISVQTPGFPILACFPWVPRAVLFVTPPVALGVWPFSSRSELIHLCLISSTDGSVCVTKLEPVALSAAAENVFFFLPPSHRESFWLFLLIIH